METTPTTVATEADWRAIAKKIITEVPSSPHKATIIALSGDLGAGKTTLVKALAAELGVDEPVTSPTFTVLKRYETGANSFQTLLHMDAYRLESVTELGPMHFDELVQQPKTLFCIEWAEQIQAALPPETRWYQLGINPEQKHTIQKQS